MTECIAARTSIAFMLLLASIFLALPASAQQGFQLPGAMEEYDAHDGPKNLVVIPDIKHYDIYTVARQQAQDLALS